MKSIFTSLLALGAAALLTPAPVHATPVHTLTSLFDNSGLVSAEPPSLLPSTGLDLEHIVGTGTMTYVGEVLGDGVYDYTSFDGLTLAFSFDGDITFSDQDLQTDPSAAGLKIVIIGSTFQFSAAPNGLSNGSADFINGTQLLSFSPAGYPFYAYFVAPPALGIPVPDTDGGLFGNIYAGRYGAVNAIAIPEPGTYAALLGVLTLGAVIVHRRRATTKA